MDNRQKLLKLLGYSFDDEAYLTQALTHRSVGKRNYERLEFLGDSILNFVVAAYLYDKFPQGSEGELSRLRASLVKEDTLAKVAKRLQLGDYLLLGGGELKSGGFRRSSILADALEAIIGAVYLDSGVEPARKMILSLFEPELESASPRKNLKDSKTKLQEFLQKRKLSLPVYEVVAVVGDPHDQEFTVECSIEEMAQKTTGKGSSRRKAEQESAKQMLNILENA